MIHAYAILTGYIAMRGSLIIHLAMFMTMCFFVRLPDNDDKFPGGRVWYFFGLFMHLILASFQFSIVMTSNPPMETFK